MTTELTFRKKVTQYHCSIGFNQQRFAGHLGIKQNLYHSWTDSKKLNIIYVKRVIEALVNLEAVTTLQQAHELLELAFPGQPIMHHFNTEQNEAWYKNLLANSTHQPGHYPNNANARQAQQNIPVANSSGQRNTNNLADHYHSIITTTGAEISQIPPRLSAKPIGRDKEIKNCIGLLKNKDIRLLTLVGPGGVGKTRLVVEIAHEAKEREMYRDGVTFLNLVALRTGEELAILLCQAFGLRGSPFARPETNANAGESYIPEAIELLVSHLRAKNMLIVLDNFEQLVDKASIELIASLIARTYNLQIVITTRQILKIEDEQIVRVPTLPLPPRELRPVAADASASPGAGTGTGAAPFPSPEELLRYGAVELLITRAKRARHDFVFNRDNAAQIVELCYRLDGLPLALELAGAHIAKHSIDKLLSLNKNPLYAIDSKVLGTLPERHRNLIHLLNWSYDLLAREEKRLFSRLSVFTEGFDAEAVAAICFRGKKGYPEVSPLQAEVFLDDLIDQSLVQVEVAQDGTGSNRYYLLETLRDYASLKLAGAKITAKGANNVTGTGKSKINNDGEPHDNTFAGEEWNGSEKELAALQEWHAEYYLKVAKEAQPYINEQANLEWLTRLKGELANILTALSYYIKQHKTVKAYDLAACLGPFWFRTKLFGEGVKWTDNVLSLISSNEQLPTIPLQASFLHQAGRLNNSAGQRTKARRLFSEAEKYWRELGDKKGLCLTLSGLGAVAYWEEDYIKASNYHEESASLARLIGDDYTLSIALANLNSLAILREEYTQSKIFATEGLLIERKLGNEIGTANRLRDLGLVARVEKDYSLAYNLYEQSLTIFKGLGNAYLGNVLEVSLHITKVDYLLDNYKLMEERTREGLQLTKAFSLHAFLPHWLLNIGLLLTKVNLEGVRQIVKLIELLKLANLVSFDNEDNRTYNQLETSITNLEVSPNILAEFKDSNVKIADELERVYIYAEQLLNNK